MSLHNNPKYQIPALVDALKQHGLKHNIPSQLADAFRTGWVAALAAPAQVATPDMTDAYAGAREDLSIWKKRALEAEALNRKFAASVNSPSFMGEPAAPAKAGEYPPLVCDYCGALTPDPWHSSGTLHGKMSKHIHSCDACCAARAAQGGAA